jgi:hypothetical protein
MISNPGGLQFLISIPDKLGISGLTGFPGYAADLPGGVHPFQRKGS